MRWWLGLVLLVVACGDERPGAPPPGPRPPQCVPGGDGIHVICLEATDLAWSALHADPQGSLEIQVGLWLDGVRRPGARLELHGGFARTVPKKSYRLRFGDDPIDVDLFGAGVEAHKRVVLQAAWVDPTFLRNKLTLELVRASGGLAPRVSFARVLVNGELLGFYTLIERVDAHLLERAGLRRDPANLYKAEGNEADWSKKANPMAGFDHELGEEHPTDDLGALLATLADTPATAEAFAGDVEPRLHVDDFLVYQRVHTLAQNRDAYSKNYLLYHDLAAAPDTPEARFRLISWDADATFCQYWNGTTLPGDDTRWYGWDAFSPRLFSIPAYRERYRSDYRAALAAELSPASLEAATRALAAQIGADARADLARWQPDLDFDAEIERLVTCFARRAEVMEGVLAGP